MIQFRPIKVNVWTDPKIQVLNFKQKLLFVYLLTNDYTNFVGCYEFSKSKISQELDIDIIEIDSLVMDLIELELVRFDEETDEVLIVNWSKHNWSISSDANLYIFSGIKKVKSLVFKLFLLDKFQSRKGVSRTKLIEYVEQICTDFHRKYPQYSIEDNTNTITNTITNTNSNRFSDTVYQNSLIDSSEEVYENTNTISHPEKSGNTLLKSDHYKTQVNVAKEVIRYLNWTAKSSFPEDDSVSLDYILDILIDHTIDECKKVIDLKVQSWSDDRKMSQFLRPKTLFKRSNFETYLNSPSPKSMTEIISGLL